MITPLPYKELSFKKEYQRRVMFFDPTEIFKKLRLNPNNRFHTVSLPVIFPKNGNVCGCGCGVELTGRKRRWATKECESFAVDVWAIIAGRPDTISSYLDRYYGWVCAHCGSIDKGHDFGNYTVSWIKIDHIVAVKNGGGACWLSNYQLVCHDCHVKKTNKDFGFAATP